MPDGESGAQLLPARMINEFVYCPRLFWLEYVEREFEHSFDTVDGQRVHRRVDRPRGELPSSVEEMKGDVTAVELSSERLGIVAKIDMLRRTGDEVVPIDFKRGKLPPIEIGVYEPERVQLCLQALLLREAGYACTVGRIYFAASKAHVDVVFDDDLVATTLAAIDRARRALARTSIPPPLIDSPKCPRCSLNAICLPDEIAALRAGGQAKQARPFVAAADDRVPLYVLQAGARVGLSGEVVQIRTDQGVQAEVPLIEVGNVSLFGNAQISSQAMRAALGRDVPVFYLSYGGWMSGYARSINDHSLDLRVSQHEVARDEARSLAIARSMILGKVKNQRTMVRRSMGERGREILQALSLLAHKVETATSAETLLGLEGAAARYYLDAFGEMLTVATGFEITGRNRRPPTDPVNAMLSFGYSMLAKEALAALITVGFEPGLGLYHKVRAGRPSLALDLMEEFRPLIVDSTILSIVNAKEIRSEDFDRRGKAIVLTAAGRRTFIGAIERRLRSTIIHPTFGYQVTYRRALNIQARLLARVVQGDIPQYPAFMTR